jgi:hypothetical protein
MDSDNMAEFFTPSLLYAYITLGQCLLDKYVYNDDNSRC